MLLQSSPPIHLAYCQNIHPGESWLENLESLRSKTLDVRNQVHPASRFGLGLRMGAHAADDLGDSEALESGRRFFEAHDLYPFTVNGFPYGRFHRGPVKEQVYAPDWRSETRVEYTCRLADILSDWIPEGGEAGISTVPGSYAAWIHTPHDVDAIGRSLGKAVVHLARIEHSRGKYIHLGLEPEPDCFLETTAQTVDFFQTALPAAAVPVVAKELQISAEQAEGTIRRHLGVCFDTCHIALQFENLTESLNSLERAGIKISKIQLSAAIKTKPHAEGTQALRWFEEPIYLHQVKGRAASGRKRMWRDLPELFSTPQESLGDLEELRVHFHVPLFFDPRLPLQSTRDALDAEFWTKVRSGICPHLEIETYTFDVLPPEAHPGDVVQSITREYRWVLDQIAGKSLVRAAETEKPSE
jgi:hypothetical protein